MRGGAVWAISLAERLMARLEASPQPLQEQAISASIGIAIFTPAGNQINDPASLMQAADSALYQAKCRGRDQIKVA
jgi:diguanylate cyclase (GGDEF)-like protein